MNILELDHLDDEDDYSLNNVISAKLNDRSSSDFRIVCRYGYVFHVHRWMLQSRSEYFERMFSQPDRYIENQTGELDLR